ncbi:hypothetical protein [Ulvibacter litoralis]|uniref:Uncharacterized protein n=1 Tax=Ulvibacter litoralis TaxID=227084 RepID=A0A1G7J1B1_9FLAO|nr:hypothetical protein [Ulvibacter litoralis]GHC60461.1 hypothetical protein GCM10008083_26730 [Ulvibacter litoralis]SDF18594.1 hypothetical protein SAMN05421855_10832 [Ulvibacter litoralis]
MENSNKLVNQKMRELIEVSCDIENSGDTYYSLHKSLLKFFFNAIAVTIDYDKKLISLWNSKPTRKVDFKLYGIDEAVSAKVNYTNLEDTLKGCLEEGEKQERFYRSLLAFYSQKSSTGASSNFKSA